VEPRQANNELRLAKATDPRVREGIARVHAMSDDELRHLVRGEPSIVVEAAESIIAKRHETTPAS
jgi:hypothetical protein